MPKSAEAGEMDQCLGEIAVLVEDLEAHSNL